MDWLKWNILKESTDIEEKRKLHKFKDNRTKQKFGPNNTQNFYKGYE